MISQCIVCKSRESKVVFNEFGIEVLKCQNCGHVFSTYETQQDYNGYFSKLDLCDDNQFWWDAAHSKMYKNFCDQFILNKKGKLLDVGCGLGYFVKHMENHPVWETWGCEISQEAVNYAKDKLGLSNVISGKIEEAGFSDNSFDIITLWDVIEHIPDPDPLLAKANVLLRPQGMIFLHTPNANIQLSKAKIKRLLKGMKPNVHYLEAKDHINLYTEKTINTVLRRNGFNNIKFIHLKPVQSVSGSRNQLLACLKSIWAAIASYIYQATFHKINLGNLFVMACKDSDERTQQ